VRRTAQQVTDGPVRLTWRLVLMAVALCLIRVTLTAVDFYFYVPGFTWARTPKFLVESSFIALWVVTAALMAERAAAHGVSRLKAYTAAAGIAALATGTSCALFESTVALLAGQQLPVRSVVSVAGWATSDSLFWCGLSAFLYANHRRLLASTRELRVVQERHAIHQRELADSGLRALRARVDPEALIESLSTIRRRYEAAPGEAESDLTALIARLRVATARASP
jgi:hypothetical protein